MVIYAAGFEHGFVKNESCEHPARRRYFFSCIFLSQHLLIDDLVSMIENSSSLSADAKFKVAFALMPFCCDLRNKLTDFKRLKNHLNAQRS